MNFFKILRWVLVLFFIFFILYLAPKIINLYKSFSNLKNQLIYEQKILENIQKDLKTEEEIIKNIEERLKSLKNTTNMTKYGKIFAEYNIEVNKYNKKVENYKKEEAKFISTNNELNNLINKFLKELQFKNRKNKNESNMS